MNQDSQVGGGDLVRVRSEFGLDVDDEGRSDRRNQTGLSETNAGGETMTQRDRLEQTDEDEGGVEVFVILPGVVLVKLVGVLAIDGEEVGA